MLHYATEAESKALDMSHRTRTRAKRRRSRQLLLSRKDGISLQVPVPLRLGFPTLPKNNLIVCQTSQGFVGQMERFPQSCVADHHRAVRSSHWSGGPPRTRPKINLFVDSSP
jgi:hypothetical protein